MFLYVIQRTWDLLNGEYGESRMLKRIAKYETIVISF